MSAPRNLCVLARQPVQPQATHLTTFLRIVYCSWQQLYSLLVLLRVLASAHMMEISVGLFHIWSLALDSTKVVT